MSSHTPGPWEIKRHYDPGYKNISAPKHSGLAQVVWCMEGDERSPECEANAHLIAAAPELLEALEELFHLINDAHDGERVFTFEIQRKARAAIAKARGE